MKLRLGMIGGGQVLSGAVHRIAARIDDEYELVCGAFSSDPEKSKASGIALGLAPNRVYNSYKELIEKEKKLPENERVQVISIVTPNHVHFEPTKLALENGFHVILDKPMTFSLTEAKELDKVVKSSGKRFCLTHTYTGYPMVKEAKQLIKAGNLGKIRKIYVEYPQGWLSTFLEGDNQKQAAWRTDPGKSGIAGAMGDIGTHAFNLAEYISGLQVTKLCADINIVVEGRKLDDDGAALLKYNNGASGVLMATQIAAGDENNIKIRVYGEKGGLEWQQDEANTLLIKWLDKPAEIWRTGGGYLSSFANHNTRTPAGHPEGYLEAFANLYRNFALSVKADMEGKTPDKEWLDYPGIEDGVRGMAFVENVIASGKSDKSGSILQYKNTEMTTIKGPAIFLAQFMGAEAPFNNLKSICEWAKSLGYKGVQIPSWDPSYFDLKKAAESKTYADEIKGIVNGCGLEITELSTHLQGQLVAVNPAYDQLFDGFAPAEYQNNPKARQEWAVQQLKYAAKASQNLGLNASATFSGALLWQTIYPWPQRPAGLVETGFTELAKRWKPILDVYDECGVDLCYEIHPGEDLHDGITYEMFLEKVKNHPRACLLYDPSHFVLQCLDYLEYIDNYHERIRMFHVKDAEFNPTGKQGVYGGYQSWVNRAGRFRSLGDGQVDFKGIFSKLAQYDFKGWAVLEWECALKHPEDGAKEGAVFIKDHIIRVTERAFDDFASAGSDEEFNRSLLGIK